MSDRILDFLPPMIVGLAFIYMLGAVITAVLESRRGSLAIRARADLLNRVLDKFGSSRDFIELSESPGGKRLLEALGSEPNGVGEKILSAVQRGVARGAGRGRGWSRRGRDSLDFMADQLVDGRVFRTTRSGVRRELPGSPAAEARDR